MYLLLIIAFNHKNGQWQQIPISLFFSYVTAFVQFYTYFLYMNIKWQWANAKMRREERIVYLVFFIKEIHVPVSDAIYSASICLITNNNIQTQKIRLLRCFTMRIDTLRFRCETENCKTGGGGLRREKVVGIKVSGKNECLLMLQAFIYF